MHNPLHQRLLAACACYAGLALALPARAESSGELLYSTHCIACHSTQVHWRNKKLATDWNSLTAQVRRWQKTTALGWNEDEINSVARYLNDKIYKFPNPSERLSQRSP
jgi:mono/diheme cytochrome c family protein